MFFIKVTEINEVIFMELFWSGLIHFSEAQLKFLGIRIRLECSKTEGAQIQIWFKPNSLGPVKLFVFQMEDFLWSLLVSIREMLVWGQRRIWCLQRFSSSACAVPKVWSSLTQISSGSILILISRFYQTCLRICEAICKLAAELDAWLD